MRLNIGTKVSITAMNLYGANVNSTGWGQLANYTINSQSDWDNIPIGIKTNGGIIDVNPSIIYSDVNLTSLLPSSELIFRSSTPFGTMPKVNIFVLSNVQNLTFDRIDIHNNSWTYGNPACVRFQNSTKNMRFKNCYIHGTYRGDRNYVIDYTKNNYPEFCCIYVRIKPGAPGTLEFSTDSSFGAGGGQDGSYVGDLLADGTYNAQVNVPNGSGATCQFTVTAGYITITSQTPGSGYSVSSNSLMSDVRIVDNSGNIVRCFAELLPNGFSSSGTNHMSGYFEITDCFFQNLNGAIKSEIPPLATGAYTKISGNFFDGIYQDVISISAGPTFGAPLEVSWNVATRYWAKSKDPQNPHSDNAQIRMNFNGDITDGDWENCSYFANIAFMGLARGNTQMLFIANNVTSPNTIRYFSKWFIAANVLLGYGSIAFQVTAGKYIYAFRNIAALWDYTKPNTIANMAIGKDNAAGWNYAGYNITESIGSADMSIMTIEGNDILAAANSTAYNNQFFSPNSFPSTSAGVIAAYANKTGKLAGPLVSFYADYVNRILDKTQEPPMWLWPSITNQTVSTLVQTNWSYYFGGPLGGRTVTPTAGSEIRYADDEVGTNASAWFSSAFTLLPGKYIQGRGTTSSTGSTTTTIGMTAGGVTRVCNVTTAITPYGKVGNAGVGLVARGAVMGSKADVQKIMFYAELRAVSLISTNPMVCGNPTASKSEFYRASASLMALYLADGSSTGQARWSQTLDTNWHKYLAVYDTTQTDPLLGLRVWVDDIEQSLSVRNFTSGTQHQLSTFLSNLSLGGKAGALVNCEYALVGYGWGSASDTLVDMTQQVNRNRFLKDNFLTSNPFAGLNNWVAYSGDAGASAFNSNAVTNLNSGLSAPLSTVSSGWVAA